MDPRIVGFRRAVARFASRIGLGPAFRQVGVSPITGNICISMVKNEQDIIEPFIRHNMKFFDAMIILDNGSDDRTREIIIELSRELGTVFVADLPFRQYDQSLFMSNALRYVQSAFFADVVCFLDADEFISAHSRAAFDAVAARIPVGSIGLMPWHTFLPDPAVPESDAPDPLARMGQRRKVEMPEYFKILLRLGGELDPTLTVEQGNHQIRNGFGKRLAAVALPDLSLLHFPVRSSAQYVTKGVVGWLAHKARVGDGVGPTDAFQWHRIHDVAEAGKTFLSVAELADEAMCYAQSRGPADFVGNSIAELHGINLERRYSDGSYGDPDQLVAAAKSPGPMRSQTFTLPDPPTRANLAPGIVNAFEGAWHWDFLFLDLPPIQNLIEKFRPSSVLDIGCGNGAYPLLYKFFGVNEVLGLDGIEQDSTVLTTDEYRKVDLQIPYDAGRKFDLVVCLEVIEHVHPETTDIVLATIERHATDLIVFSMAEPGQPGNGHINCRTISDVLDLWAQRGWQPELTDTLATRALSTMSWFRRNLLVLRRTGQTGETAAARQLRQIGAMPYRWYGQKPGLRLAAFAEPYPELGYGFDLRLP